MANLSVRNLDDKTVAGLKARATKNGVSMEEEVRRILASAANAVEESMGEAMVRIFAPTWDGEPFDIPKDLSSGVNLPDFK